MMTRFALLLGILAGVTLLAEPKQMFADGPNSNLQRPGGKAPPAKKDDGKKDINTKSKSDSKYKKYDEVITDEAKTQTGVFAVHQIGDKLYFEIPEDRLNKLMLYRAEVASGATGLSHNGRELGSKFLRFERRDNKIDVIIVGFDKRSDESNKAAVEASQVQPIVGTYTIEAEGKDRSAVIQVSKLFLADELDIGAKRAAGFGGRAIEADKSYLMSIKAFPLNIESRAMLTIKTGGAPGAPGGGGAGDSVSAIVHYSLFQLPDEPMQGRKFDPRVGYFTESFSNYSSKEGWVQPEQYITRYRLEKKDPKAEVSEVVKPITFYLAPEIPAQWREPIRKGVEDWKPLFEAAGYKNAIVCLDPPSKAEDPNWDPEDARYSVIRWVAEPTANAMGPHVHDPRSGEIISAHIIFWQDIVKLVHMWYFVQCSALDDRARQFPFPEDLTGELIRYVAAHEVGHTLGLRHNHRASQAYSIKDLRDPKFVEKYGSVASIMSYGRYNYVAQPEDKIPVKDLIPKMAPYDFFAIKWGYKNIDNPTSEGEKPTLDQWASEQIKNKYLRFGGEDGPSSVDPTVLTENIGDDAIEATKLGIKNTERIFGYLLTATTAKGEDFDMLKEAYDQIIGHRQRWLSAVAKIVGGVIENRTLGQRGEQFTRVPKERQKAAVQFLLENAFETPKSLLDPALVNLMKYQGVADGIMSNQTSLLASLMSDSRLNRLLDAEVLSPDDAYPLAELVSDVQTGLWKELTEAEPKVDPLRRNLQRVYVATLTRSFAPEAEPAAAPTGRRGFGGGSSRPSELRAAARVALRGLEKDIQAALPKVKDSNTKAHLEDNLAVIQEALNPAAK